MKMHFFIEIVPYLFLLHSHHSQATPIAQNTVNPCSSNPGGQVSYTVTKQEEIEGDKDQLPFSCTAQPHATCTIGRGQSFSVAVTVEVGLDLGLNFKDIVDVGLSASVSVTTETGSVDTAEAECPEGIWTCALVMTPALYEVSGKKSTAGGGCEPTTTEEDYTVRFPIEENNTPKANFEICACKNKLGWADPGAPAPCPEDCA